MAPAASREGTAEFRPAWGKLAAASLVLVAMALAWRYTPLSQFLTLERIRGWAQAIDETKWAPYAVAAAYTPAALLMCPRQVLTLLAVIAFGTWVGLAVSASGILVAALIAYSIGRVVPYASLRRLFGSRLDIARELLQDHGTMTIFAFNMVPFPPFAVKGLVAGSMKVKAREFAQGTLLALLPGALVIAFFGDEISALVGENRKASYWMLGAAVVVLIAMGLVTRRWAQKRLARRAALASA